MNFFAFIQAQSGLETSFAAIFLLILLQPAFVKTHENCRCGKHKGCFSIRADGSAYCFSCNQNFLSDSPPPRIESRVTPRKTLELRTIPDSEIHRSIFQIPNSPFCRTCEKITGKKAETNYYIGAYTNQVIFWVRDFEGIVRNKKVISYQPNGYNRDKNKHPYVLNGAFMPFFGEEHLQAFVNTNLTDVFFVESEKTAIYCQFTFAWALWLSCGAATGATRRKIERVKHLLAEKRLFVLFDNDDGGKTGTETALANFKRCGLSANALAVSDLFPQAPDKADLADCIWLGSGVTL